MHLITENLSEIARSNETLAVELARLPEISSCPSPSAGRALGNFLQVYQTSPDTFDAAFDRINKIGHPASRDYCSPLQAIFWLVQDGKIHETVMLLGLDIKSTKNPDGIYTNLPLSGPDPLPEADLTAALKKILDAAWKHETKLMINSLIHQIIRRIRTKAARKEYALLIRRHDDRQLQGYIMDDFMTQKEIFDVRDWKIIEAAIRRSRWKQFFTVADRLNAPRLISYYIENFFSFTKKPAHGVYLTFFKNRAQCTDAAYFAQYMLKRAGYKTFIRSVKWNEDPWNGLHTGAGIILENGSYQLVANYTGINSVSGGPYKDIDSLDAKLSCGRKIIDSKWGAYYPPRHY